MFPRNLFFDNLTPEDNPRRFLLFFPVFRHRQRTYFGFPLRPADEVSPGTGPGDRHRRRHQHRFGIQLPVVSRQTSWDSTAVYPAKAAVRWAPAPPNVSPAAIAAMGSSIKGPTRRNVSVHRSAVPIPQQPGSAHRTPPPKQTPGAYGSYPDMDFAKVIASSSVIAAGAHSCS